MTRTSPALPAIGGGKTKFQPVYVGDVADAVVAAIRLDSARGRTFELGGPGTYTFRELLTFILKEIDRGRVLLPLPFAIAKPMGITLEFVFKLIPFFNAPITSGQVEMLRTDNITGISGDAGIGTLADLGVTKLESIESVVPTYLWRYRAQGEFHETRKAS